MSIQTIEKELRKKRRQKITTIFIGIYAICVIYFGIHIFTVMSQSARNNFFNSIEPGLAHAFSKPFSITISWNQFLILLIAIGLPILMREMKKAEKEIKKHDNPDTVNGEAHLMTAQELEAYKSKYISPLGDPKKNDGFNNMILSKDIFLAIDNRGTRRNCNILTIGGSGAGKSRFFGGPNILQANCNFVVTDPSGELRRDYGKFLENIGYEVLTFDIVDVYRSNRYNPFAYIREEKDVYILAESIIQNTTPPKGTPSDPIWVNGEKLLLQGFMLYLWHLAPIEQQNFTQVVEMIKLAQIDENDASAESPLDKMFNDLERLDKENLAVHEYKIFKTAAGKTAKSFLISLGARLQAFNLPDIKYLTSKDEFHFDKFSDRKRALFIIIPTDDKTFNYIVSLLYTQLFMETYRYCELRAEFGWKAQIGKYNILHTEQAVNKTESKTAKKEILEFIKNAQESTIQYNKEKKLYEIHGKDGRIIGWRGSKEEAEKLRLQFPKMKAVQNGSSCPYHVRLILDEFANLGQIPSFSEKVATMRKYEMSVSIILQSLSQLKDLYPQQWNTIAGNCDTKLFLGTDDIETIEWMLKMLGKKTTVVENQSYNTNGSGSVSYNHSSQDLLTVDQISMMQDNECLVRIRGVRPYYGKKYDIEQHPNYKKAMAVKGEYEVPLTPEAKAYREEHSGRLQDRLRKKREKAKAEREAAENENPDHTSTSEINTKSHTKANLENAQKEKDQTEFEKQNSEKSSSPRKKTKEEREKENSIRKTNAKKEADNANKALKEIKNSTNEPELDEEKAEQLFSAFGITQNATTSEITEVAESILQFTNPDINQVKYSYTK